MKKHLSPSDWLKNELPFWLESGWIQAPQAEALQAHYAEKAPVRQPLLNIFALLGAVLIGIGIILLLGYNWSELSRTLRTLISLGLLLSAQGISAWALWRHRDSLAWRESSACFQILAMAAAIALIGQTYHISGDLRSLLLTCVLLGLPLIYLLNANFSAILCVWGLGSWYLLHLDTATMPDLLFWGLWLLLLPQMFWSWQKRPEHLSTHFLLGSLAVIGAGGLLTTFSDSWLKSSWFVILGLIATCYYLGGQRLKALGYHGHSLTWMGQIVLWVLAFVFSTYWAWQEAYFLGQHLPSDFSWLGSTYLADHLWLLLLPLGWLGLWLFHSRQLTPLTHLWACFPLILILGWGVSQSLTPLLATVLLNIYLLALGVVGLWQGLHLRQPATVTGSTLLLAVLIVLRFMDAEMSLMGRGLAFIGVGIAFLLSNLMLVRHLRTEVNS